MSCDYEPNIYRFYMISNTINEHVYIGKTTKTIKERFIAHKSAAKIHTKRKLYKMFNELGHHNFYIEELESCMCNYKHESEVKENYWINRYKPTLNTCTIKCDEYDDDDDDTIQRIKNRYGHPSNKAKNINEMKKQKHNDNKLMEEQRLEHMTLKEQDEDFIERMNRDNAILNTRTKANKKTKIKLDDIFNKI